jgi:hypothetical protein
VPSTTSVPSAHKLFDEMCVCVLILSRCYVFSKLMKQLPGKQVTLFADELLPEEKEDKGKGHRKYELAMDLHLDLWLVLSNGPLSRLTVKSHPYVPLLL